MKATGVEGLAAAQRVIEHASRTRYQSEAVIDEKTGTHLALIPKGADERYPRAFELFDLLHEKEPPGWSYVESVAKIGAAT